MTYISRALELSLAHLIFMGLNAECKNKDKKNQIDHCDVAFGDNQDTSFVKEKGIL